MILDDGHARVEDSCLIGARSLDPPEQAFIATSGLATELGSLEGVAGAYIAFDCDVLDPKQRLLHRSGARTWALPVGVFVVVLAALSVVSGGAAANKPQVAPDRGSFHPGWTPPGSAEQRWARIARACGHVPHAPRGVAQLVERRSPKP